MSAPAPVGAVDREVDPAPVLRRDHLVDGRVDRGVLAADAHAGDDPGGVQEDDPVAAAGRRRGEPAADQVDAEGDHEEVLAAELVGQLAEEQRPDDLADQVPPGDVGDRARAQVQRVVQGQVGPDVAGDGDLEAVEDPGDAERDDQPGMEPRPGQPVDPGRDQAADIRTVCRFGRRIDVVIRNPPVSPAPSAPLTHHAHLSPLLPRCFGHTFRPGYPRDFETCTWPGSWRGTIQSV